MNCCIFCKSTTGPFKTREHILPESLGGGEWAILPPGLFCDGCQNFFGSAIEQQALGDYPFNLLRVFLGIPTKKGKAPWLSSWEGKIAGGPVPGIIHYGPASPFELPMSDGGKSAIRLLAEPQKPAMICRTLLKMALEVIAADSPTDALAGEFDDARHFARWGTKPGAWWYLQREDHALAAKLFRREVINDFEPIVLEMCRIGEADDMAEVFHLRLFFLDMFVPMESRILPDVNDLPEPEYRLFAV